MISALCLRPRSRTLNVFGGVNFLAHDPCCIEILVVAAPIAGSCKPASLAHIGAIPASLSLCDGLPVVVVALIGFGNTLLRATS